MRYVSNLANLANLAILAVLLCAACSRGDSAAPAPNAVAEKTDETPMPAEHREAVHGHEHGHGHGDHFEHRFEKAEDWVARFDDPARDEWQKPGRLMTLLGVAPGMRVADIGAGTGYFTMHLARAVGEGGAVLALDVEPDMVRHITERAAGAGLENVSARAVATDDPGLAPGSLDRILIVNTWHHIGARPDYARKLAQALAPGGTLAIVDYTKEAPHGPPVEHRLTPEQVIEELTRGGLQASAIEEDLPLQYVVVARAGATAGIEFADMRVIGNLYIGGQPTPDQLRAATAAGVKTVVNTRSQEEPGAAEEAALLAELGVTYVSIPVTSGEDLTRAAVDQLDAALRAAGDQPVIVHCASGNRVGALFAMRAHLLQGKAPEEALQIGRDHGLTRMEPAVREKLKVP